MPFSYYQNLSPRQRRIYQESDRIETIELPRSPALQEAVVLLESALAGGDRAATSKTAQTLMDRLTAELSVSRLRVQVRQRRPSLATGELHGLYQSGEEGRHHRVSVWMRTAQRAQVVRFKTFLRTLLHELCHHLDYERFHFEETFHTEGFYKRESSLFRQLYPP